MPDGAARFVDNRERENLVEARLRGCVAGVFMDGQRVKSLGLLEIPAHTPYWASATKLFAVAFD